MTTYTIYPIPGEVRGSEYLNLLYKHVENGSTKDAVFRVKKFSWKILFAPRATGERRIIHIHWETNIYGSRYIVVSIVRMAYRFPFLLLMKARGIRILWTLHNRYAHDYPHARIDAFGRFIMWHLADTVVVQQKSIAESERLARPYAHIVFIPHPNFVGVFGPIWQGDRNVLRSRYGIKGDEIILLAFGSVRPYKSLPALIDAVTEARAAGANVRLFIAGKASEEYGKIIAQKVGSNPAVILRLAFVPIEKVSEFLALADYSILYYEDSSLTSGPLLMSLSYGVPVITRDMPASEIITDKNGFVFHDARRLGDILLKLDTIPIFDRNVIIDSSGEDWPTMASKLNRTYIELWSK